MEKRSELKAVVKSRNSGQYIDKEQYYRIVSMNDAIGQNPYDTSPFRSARRPMKGENGELIRKSGIMAVAKAGGMVKAGDPIQLVYPVKPYLPLERV